MVMKIGVVSGFVDFRNDLRELVKEMTARTECVLFIPKQGHEDWGPRLKDAGFEARPILETTDGLWNRVVKKLFSLFMRLPASRNNYYLMEIFKIAQIKDEAQRREARAILNRRMRMPHFFRYDWFLRLLRPSGRTDFSDIDSFLFITEVCSDGFLARVLASGKPCYIYLYSWDHAFKNVRYTRRVKYLAWNEGAVEDLRDMQGVPKSNTVIVGSTQLGFMNRFRALPDGTSPYPFKYVSFGCAIALPQLIGEEIAVAERIARILAECAPDLKLVVRPYPILSDWSVYARLRDLPNVVMEDGFRRNGNAVSNQEINDKFTSIRHSEGFFHLGTTLGLEAAFTGSPTFLIDLFALSGDALSVASFVHQTQNDKYINKASGRNLIRDETRLREVLTDLGKGKKAEYLEANEAIARQFPVKSFSEIAKAACAVIEKP